MTTRASATHAFPSQEQVSVQADGAAPYEAFALPEHRIRAFVGQPRTYFDPQRLQELADSIREVGQITPGIVKRVESDPNYEYELVDGERRLLACRMIGLPTFLATVRVVADEHDQFVKSFVANFAHESHTPLETARGIARIRSSPQMQGLKPMEQIQRIARMAARSDAWVWQHLNLLNLHPMVQEMMEAHVPIERRVNVTVGIALCAVTDKEAQAELAATIVRRGYNVSKARSFIAHSIKESGIPRSGRGRKPSDDYIVLKNFLRKVVSTSELVLDMPHHSLRDLFKNRKREDLVRSLEQIDAGIEALKTIREEILSNSR